MLASDFKSNVEYRNDLGASAANISIRYKKDFLPTEKAKETVLTDETLEKLERLGTLKENGVITKLEFIELKRKLI